MIAKSEFVSTIAPLIVKEGKARGYYVFSPIIAQAVIESAYGQSGLSANYNNFFGLKCGSSWKGKSVNMKTKEEYTPGTLTTISDNFRTYDSVEDGVKGYFDFISTNRYANLKTAKTPLEYCQMLKSDGYATSSSYVNTLMNCIKNLGLTKYDSGEITVTPSVPISTNISTKNYTQAAKDVINGKYGNGDERKNKLNSEGYNSKVVQDIVNDIIINHANYDYDAVATDVINGKYGNGENRVKQLTSKGYNAKIIQEVVNEKLKGC